MREMVAAAEEEPRRLKKKTAAAAAATNEHCLHADADTGLLHIGSALPASADPMEGSALPASADPMEGHDEADAVIVRRGGDLLLLPPALLLKSHAEQRRRLQRQLLVMLNWMADGQSLKATKELKMQRKRCRERVGRSGG